MWTLLLFVLLGCGSSAPTEGPRPVSPAAPSPSAAPESALAAADAVVLAYVTGQAYEGCEAAPPGEPRPCLDDRARAEATSLRGQGQADYAALLEGIASSSEAAVGVALAGEGPAADAAAVFALPMLSEAAGVTQGTSPDDSLVGFVASVPLAVPYSAWVDDERWYRDPVTFARTHALPVDCAEAREGAPVELPMRVTARCAPATLGLTDRQDVARVGGSGKGAAALHAFAVVERVFRRVRAIERVPLREARALADAVSASLEGARVFLPPPTSLDFDGARYTLPTNGADCGEPLWYGPYVMLDRARHLHVVHPTWLTWQGGRLAVRGSLPAGHAVGDAATFTDAALTAALTAAAAEAPPHVEMPEEEPLPSFGDEDPRPPPRAAAGLLVVADETLPASDVAALITRLRRLPVPTALDPEHATTGRFVIRLAQIIGNSFGQVPLPDRLATGGTVADLAATCESVR